MINTIVIHLCFKIPCQYAGYTEYNAIPKTNPERNNSDFDFSVIF